MKTMNPWTLGRWVLATMLSATSAMVMPVSVQAISFNFQQIDWGDGLGGFNAQNSDWGRAGMQLSPTDASLFFPDGFGGFFGYLNVVTSVPSGVMNNWAVQNVPFAFSNVSEFNGRLADGLMFDLTIPSGTNVSSLGYHATISPNPYGAAPLNTDPFVLPGGGPVQVFDSNHIFGGFEDLTISPLVTGGTDRNPPPKAQNTVALGANEMIHSTAKISGMEANVPAIDEELNGCAPGSAARSIHYLAQFNPSLVTDLGTTTPQQTYDKLKMKMMTAVGKNAAGTSVAKFKTGKDAYDMTELPTTQISTTQTGRTEMDFMAAMMALANKGDVEAMIWWGKDAMNMSLGGHAAFVSEIIKIKDATTGMTTGFKVSIIDDRPQGDMMANNTKTVLEFDAMGNLKGYGNMAQLIGFQVETVVPEPTFGGVLLIAIALCLRWNRLA